AKDHLAIGIARSCHLGVRHLPVHAKEMSMPRTHLNHVRTFAAAASLTLVLTLGACAARRPAPVADATADRVARGRQLVSIGGCNDCHTPMKFDADLGMPVPDMTRMLSGHPEGAPDPASALGGHDIAVI